MQRFASKGDRDARLDAVNAAVTTLNLAWLYVSIDLHAGESFNQLHREQPRRRDAAMKDAWRDLAQIMATSSDHDRIFATE